MKKPQSLPIKTVYYTDERNDEFSSAVITPKRIDENYRYLRREPAWSILRWLSYRLIATPLAYLYCKCTLRFKVKNRRVLKTVKKEGFFLYANHTQEIADAFLPTLATFPKSVFVIVHPDNVSMPFLGRVTPYLGALPLPSNLKAMRNFKNAVEKRILQGRCVAIYPEAHIWPYYTGIRDFPATSMKYPVEYNAPSFAMTTTYRSRGAGKKPKTVTYLDGPFYPDTAVPTRERAQELHDRIHAAMQERSALSDCEYIRYEKRGKSE